MIVLTSNINMKECNTVVPTANEQPLALIHEVLEVGGDLRLVLVGSQAFLVKESEAATTLVSTTSVAIPDLVTSNRIQFRGVVSSSMGLTYCQDLLGNIMLHENLIENLTSNPRVFKSSCTAQDASKSKPFILCEPNFSDVEHGLLLVECRMDLFCSSFLNFLVTFCLCFLGL